MTRIPAEDAAAHAGSLMSQARQHMIGHLDQSIAELTALRAALLMAERDGDHWKRRGHPTFEAWRGQTAGVGLRQARHDLRVAATLADQPHLANALKTGDVTIEHAKVIGKITEQAHRRATGLGDHGHHELLGLAKQHDADAFEKAADRWLAARDSLAHERSHEQMRQRRFLSVAHTPTGTHLKGFLDPLDGHKLRLALEAATPKPAANDTRDHGQRMADALVALSEHTLSSGDMKNGARVRPHVSLILTEDTFTQARAELHRRAQLTPSDANAATPETATAALRVDPITLEDETPIPLSAVARILCDSDITRIVVDADDQPLNLGRTQRLFSREQRRAVIARDRTCRFQGCDRPARWCEVHHIAWWTRDHGDTSTDNAILLCSFHHHELHRGNVHIEHSPRPVAIPVAGDADTDRPGTTRPIGPIMPSSPTAQRSTSAPEPTQPGPERTQPGPAQDQHELNQVKRATEAEGPGSTGSRTPHVVQQVRHRKETAQQRALFPASQDGEPP